MASLLEAWLYANGIALAIVAAIRILRSLGLLSSFLARKALHISIGPAFIAAWTLFPASPWSPLVAASVPFGITAYFFVLSRGILKDNATVSLMSSTGEARMIADGPVHYGMLFTLCAVFWWQDPAAVGASLLLCFGDGFAAIIGKALGAFTGPLPWNASKSWAGTIGFIAVGTAAQALLLPWYFTHGCVMAVPSFTRIAVAAVCCGIVESWNWSPGKENMLVTLTGYAVLFVTQFSGL